MEASPERLRDNETTEPFIHLFAYVTVLPVSIAVISVPMNLAVIFIIVAEVRRFLGRAHQGQVHLIFLAISDLSIASVYISGAIWRLFLPGDQRDLKADDFRFWNLIWFAITATFTRINRLLTLYITVERARCIFYIHAADRLRQQTTYDHVLQTLTFGVLPGFAFSLIVEAGVAWLSPYQPEQRVQVYYWGSFMCFVGVIMVAMGVLGVFIVYTIRKRRFSNAIVTGDVGVSYCRSFRIFSQVKGFLSLR